MYDTTIWSAFFTDFAALRATADAQTPVISSEQCTAFFSRFGELHSAHMAQGMGVNFIELAGIGHDELRNCSLLAWLLDCSGSHGQGAAFLRRFIDCIREMDCPEGFPAAPEGSASYRTTLESSYDDVDSGRTRSRVDIELDGSAFLLFIEAKVQAGEGERQLARYLRIGRVRAGNRPWGLVFITPSGRQPDEEALCGNVACISWRTLGRSFLCHANTMPDTHGRIAVRQLCEHFINL